MDAAVKSVVHSDIAAWLASTGKEGRTYDRWRLFALQLFDVAEADGIVSRSPFDPSASRARRKARCSATHRRSRNSPRS